MKATGKTWSALALTSLNFKRVLSGARNHCSSIHEAQAQSIAANRLQTSGKSGLHLVSGKSASKWQLWFCVALCVCLRTHAFPCMQMRVCMHDISQAMLKWNASTTQALFQSLEKKLPLTFSVSKSHRSDDGCSCIGAFLIWDWSCTVARHLAVLQRHHDTGAAKNGSAKIEALLCKTRTLRPHE